MSFDDDVPTVPEPKPGHRPDARSVKEGAVDASAERFTAKLVDRVCDRRRVVAAVNRQLDVC
jgi:hypothetical protein